MDNATTTRPTRTIKIDRTKRLTPRPEPEPATTTSRNSTALFIRINDTQYTLRVIPPASLAEDARFQLRKQAGEVYTVQHNSRFAPTCDCPAHVMNAGEDCKHIKALRAHHLI